MTLYGVTYGCYSDYDVVAIFDSRVLAEAYCDGNSDYDIKEYELNPNADNIRSGQKWHMVELDRRGNVVNHYETFTVQSRDVTDAVAYRIPFGGGREYFFRAWILAKTKEQAVKAANERRAHYIAMNQPWPENVPPPPAPFISWAAGTTCVTPSTLGFLRVIALGDEA